MGICNSLESTSVITAKLVLQDGTLKEFPYPVKASLVLQRHPTCFICNADDLDFDDHIKGVDKDELLQPGQLYFALPLGILGHPLHAQRMAELAVKASAALMRSSGGGHKSSCCSKSFDVNPVIFTEREVKSMSARGSVVVAMTMKKKKKKCSKLNTVVGGGSNRGGRSFASELTCIPE